MKMKGPILVAAVSAALSAGAHAGITDADAAQLMTKYHCVTCHSVDKKVVGPAFKDVAKKYAGDGSAQQKLVKKVKSGGSGSWGTVPMPPNNVPDADLNQLVAWVLERK